MSDPPRVDAVAVTGPTTLAITWKASGRRSTVDLAGWIGRGNVHIAPLTDPGVFARAAVGAYGGNVTWDDDEGDLAIDAIHLELIADEQEPFEARNAVDWQQALGLSDREAADLLGVAPSAWAAYKTGASIPATIARLCRAARRDPVILHAHLRPSEPDGAGPIARRPAESVGS